MIATVSRDDLLAELQYRLSERSPGGLRDFCKFAWPIIEPSTDLAWAWFHDAMCDHLEAVTLGHINRLIINIPPRHAKSTFVAIFWPTWTWGPGNQPHSRWIFSSYAQSLSQRDSQRRRMVMDTPWYRSGWSHVFTIGRQSSKWTPDGQIKYQNSQMGYHLSTSVGGSNTGEGGDYIVYDDPHNMKEIHSETMRLAVVQFRDQVMTTRQNDQRTVREVLVMQRGHESDLSGHLLKKGGFVHLNLQAEFDPKRRCFTRCQSGPLAGTELFRDPRTTPGELLFPERFPRHVIERLKVELGDHYASQYQQDPTPAEGGIFKRAWWRYWVTPGHELAGRKDENGNEILVRPHRFQQRIDSWDMAFKDQDDHSFVVGLAFGRIGSRCYLLDMRRGHFDFIESQHQLRALRSCHPQPPNAVYVEDKANGTAILRTLRDDVPGLLASSADDSKIARAHAASPRVKAGNYVLPHPAMKGYEWVACQSMGEGNDPIPWVDHGFLVSGSFLSELTMFPNSANDDQVDAFTQADHYLLLQEEFGAGHFDGATRRDDLY